MKKLLWFALKDCADLGKLETLSASAFACNLVSSNSWLIMSPYNSFCLSCGSPLFTALINSFFAFANVSDKFIVIL